MTQYIEHYKCNGAPCVHVEPPMKQEALDYLIGQVPPRYLVPSLLGQVHINPHCVILDQANYWASDDANFWRR